MIFKRIYGVLYMWRAVRFRDGLLRGLTQSALVCLVVLVSLCGMQKSVAEARVDGGFGEPEKEGVPVLGDQNYRHDLKYGPIYGNMDGSSFFLHYCLPGFVPLGQGDCDRGSAPGKDPRGVQVEYSYYLRGRDADQARLEGSAAYAFPFPINVDLEGKTPYLAQYKKKSEISKWKSHQVVKGHASLQGRFEGLEFYESPAFPGGWWVPKDLSEYKTKLGNPPVFVCGGGSCFLSLDQGNGWIVTARFNEVALKDWREFFVRLNGSVNVIMEK